MSRLTNRWLSLFVIPASRGAIDDVRHSHMVLSLVDGDVPQEYPKDKRGHLMIDFVEFLIGIKAPPCAFEANTIQFMYEENDEQAMIVALQSDDARAGSP